MGQSKAADTFYPAAGIVILGGIATTLVTGVGGLLTSLFFLYVMLMITNGFDRGANKRAG